MTSEARSSDCLTLKTENESLAARCDLDLSQLDGTPEQINRFLHEYAATDAEDQARRLTEGDEPPEQTAEDERLLDHIWARLDTTITERETSQSKLPQVLQARPHSFVLSDAGRLIFRAQVAGEEMLDTRLNHSRKFIHLYFAGFVAATEQAMLTDSEDI